jgi:hypothetical protein
LAGAVGLVMAYFLTAYHGIGSAPHNGARDTDETQSRPLGKAK